MILETSKAGKKNHEHFAYVGQNNSGITSVDQGHSHPVVFNPPLEPVIDNGVVVVEGDPGSFVLLEADGHVHLILGPAAVVKKDLFKIPENTAENNNEELSVQRVHALQKEGRAVEEDSFKDGELAEDMAEGNQWDADLKKELENKERAALTVNEIEGKIDLLSGIQRQNRFDIRGLPNEDGDARVADIITILIKNAHANTKFEEQETRTFEDQAIVGRGLYNVFTDFDRDIRGKFVVEKFNWRDCVFGPHERLDAADADYMVKNKWFPFNRIAQMYPDKADKITIDTEKLLEKDKADNNSKIDIEPKSHPYREQFGKTTSANEDTNFINISKKQYLLMECWQKKFAQVHLVVNAIDDFFETLQGWDKADIKRIESIQGISVIPRVIFRFRVTKVAGNTLLEDEFPDLPLIEDEQFFPVVPVYAKKRRNKFWGKVKPIIDLQRANNKHQSQVMDVLVRSLPYGWFYTQNSFSSSKALSDWKKDVNTPGWTAEINDMTQKPEMQEGVKYPIELAANIAAISNQMKATMNINSELLGQTGSRQSAVAIRENKRQGLLGNDFLFDNLAFAHRRIGLMTIAHIQKYWTVERIMKVLGFEIKKNEKTTIGGKTGKEMTPQDLQDIITILEDTDLTKYDIEVAESAFTPTARLANFLQMQELAKQGVLVSPKTLLRMSDMSEKDLAMQELDEFMQQQGQAERDKNQTEIAKTQIANQ